MIDEFQKWVINYLRYDYNHLIFFTIAMLSARMVGKAVYDDRIVLISVFKKYSTLVFMAITVAALLITKYLESPSIDSTKLGNQEQFGQFGDYIGGILNPIFGFITVMLLIQSLSAQNKDLDHNKALRNMEALSKVLAESEKNFEDDIESESFEDEHGKYSFRSAFYKPEGGWIHERHENILAAIEAVVNETGMTQSNFYAYFRIARIKGLCDNIISTQIHIIEFEELDYLKRIHAARLINSVTRLEYFHLISSETSRKIRTDHAPYLERAV